ncbi:MAG: type II toxin-antitoxin system VapC family toxin [Acidobacteriota bacterium]
MPFVLDCSVTMAWVFSGEAGPSTAALLDSLVTDRAVVPSLWSLEVGNVLLTATRRGRLSLADWPRIQADLAVLPLEVDVETHNRALETTLNLAHRYDLSLYDAVYLELALRKNLPLATLDHRLQKASRRAHVALMIS